MSTDDAARPIHARQILNPGWYWAFVDHDADGTNALAAFIVKNAPNVFIARTQRGEDTGLIFKDPAPYTWILFEVRARAVIWTLPGFPSKAPKGSATLAKDIVSDDHIIPAITSPEHPFNKFFGWGWLTGEGDEDGSSSNNPLARAGDTLRTTLKVVLYGGAAILLFQLFMATGGTTAVASLFSKRKQPPPRATRLLPAGR